MQSAQSMCDTLQKPAETSARSRVAQPAAITHLVQLQAAVLDHRPLDALVVPHRPEHKLSREGGEGGGVICHCLAPIGCGSEATAEGASERPLTERWDSAADLPRQDAERV